MEIWKVEYIKLFLVKHSSIFGTGYCHRKKFHFLFYMLSLISSFKKILRKQKLLNNLARFLFITNQEKPESQKNNVRAKVGWPVLYCYFADIE